MRTWWNCRIRRSCCFQTQVNWSELALGTIDSETSVIKSCWSTTHHFIKTNPGYRYYKANNGIAHSLPSALQSGFGETCLLPVIPGEPRTRVCLGQFVIGILRNGNLINPSFRNRPGPFDPRIFTKAFVTQM